MKAPINRSQVFISSLLTFILAMFPTEAHASIAHIHHFEIFQNRLILGTHNGLFDFNAEGKHLRISRSNFDVMGLAVTGDLIYASGHPGEGDQRPSLLGLLKSSDGGKTWRQVSLLGKTDFHLLEASGDVVVGGDSVSGELFISEDAGRSWKRRGLNNFEAIALSPLGKNAAFALSRGRLFSTTDGFASKQRLTKFEAIADVAWTTSGLFISQGKNLLVSTNLGEDWKVRHTFKGKIDAIRGARKTIYIAVGANIYRSIDAGKTFSLLE